MRKNALNGKMINSKGIFFTTMILLIILSMLMLINVAEKGKTIGEEKKEIIALEEIDYLYENVQKEVIDLDKHGKGKEVMERILPFNYILGEKTVSIEQMLPLKQLQLNNFFNVINAFEVFLEDENYLNEFSSLKVQANASKNKEWEGNETEINFLINPFCISLSEDQNSFAFKESNSNKCSQEFSVENIARYDVNMEIINSGEDFNAVKCNEGACPSESFSELNPNPYYRIEIKDANCINCKLSQKIISKHFAPETEDFNIMIYCNGSSCKSKPVTIMVGKKLQAINQGNQVKMNATYEFKEKVKEFIFLDFNYSIENKAFNAIKSNFEEFE